MSSMMPSTTTFDYYKLTNIAQKLGSHYAQAIWHYAWIDLYTSIYGMSVKKWGFLVAYQRKNKSIDNNNEI